MTTAFVLAGGASLGAVQVGMLRALAQRRIAPDLLVGTSAGALNAGYLAGRGTDESTVRDLAAVWRSLHAWDVFVPDPLRAAGALIGRSTALFGDKGLKDLLTEHLAFERIEDAGTPLRVIATDLLTGQEVCLDSGPAADAILASSAIPGMLPPVSHRGRTLVDGGLADNAAISRAIGAGAETVYVLPCGFACALTEPPTTMAATLTHAMALLVHQRLIHDIDLYAAEADLIVLPPPCPLTVSPVDFGHARELIDGAYEVSDAFLSVDGGLRDNPSVHIGMHTHPEAGTDADAG